VETKQFVSSNVHVILTRQTCGQRSARTAESKCPALKKKNTTEFALFSQCQNVEETVIQVFALFWVLSKSERPLRNAKFQFLLRAEHFFGRKSPSCIGLRPHDPINRLCSLTVFIKQCPMVAAKRGTGTTNEASMVGYALEHKFCGRCI